MQQQGWNLRPVQGGAGLARARRDYQSGQVRPAQGTATEHQVVAAGDLAAAQGVRGAPYFPVGDNVQRGDFARAGDLLPVGGRAVAVALGAGVHSEFIDPRRLYCAHDIQEQALVLVTQPGFHRDRNLCRYRGAHRSGDRVYPVRLTQDDRAAVRAVDGFGRAAEVQVDTGGTQPGGARRIIRQHCWLAAQ